jgi:hypothetical protein
MRRQGLLWLVGSFQRNGNSIHSFPVKCPLVVVFGSPNPKIRITATKRGSVIYVRPRALTVLSNPIALVPLLVEGSLECGTSPAAHKSTILCFEQMGLKSPESALWSRSFGRAGIS